MYDLCTKRKAAQFWIYNFCLNLYILYRYTEIRRHTQNINMKTQILQRNEGERYSNSFVLSYPTRTHKIISIKTYSKRKDLIKLERDLM